MRREVFLTTLDMMHTHGFRAMMFMIWGATILLGAPVVYLLNKTRYKGRRVKRGGLCG